MAAIAIRAIIVERKFPRICLIIFSLLNLKNKYPKTKAMISEGVILPNVAVMAPGIPAILSPTKVAALIAIGPGVI